MKPILVKNKAEWERLAPVLEAQGKRFRLGAVPTKMNMAVTGMFGRGCELYCKMGDNELLYLDYKLGEMDTQSVDEYMEIKPMSEPDWKAKYEALEKGVKEAITEMNKQFDEEMEACLPLRADAFTDCRQIIKDKTGL